MLKPLHLGWVTFFCLEHPPYFLLSFGDSAQGPLGGWDPQDGAIHFVLSVSCLLCSRVSSVHLSGSVSLNQTKILSWNMRVVSQGSQGIEEKTGEEERRRTEGGKEEGLSKMNSEMTQKPRAWDSGPVFPTTSLCDPEQGPITL